MVDGEDYAGGLELNFFNSPEFEAENASTPAENQLIQTRNLLRLLMMGWNKNWTQLLTMKTFRAVFIARDHQLTQAMRAAFQEGFKHICSELKKHGPLSEKQQRQAEIFISNCLAFTPFADMTPYESLAIPQYIHGTWQLVDYKITPIELTPTSGFKKLFLRDDDRVFAYGLEPLLNSDAEPHLVFMGTTYPAGQGFATTVNTDLEPFETAGKKLYRTGQRRITRWLDEQSKKVHVCGTSLGGGLSLLLAIDKGDKLSSVHALNPPGLYDPWRKSKFDHWDTLETKPPVFILKQRDDPVSRFGVWKPDWHVLDINPPDNIKGPNSITHHALNYAGFANTEFIVVNTALDNEERKSRNFWLYVLSRSAVYYLVMVPWRYVIRPLNHFIFNHKLPLAMTLLMVGLLTNVPSLLIALSGSLLINVLVPAVITGYLIGKFAADIVTNDTPLSQFLLVLKTHPVKSLVFGLVALALTACFIASVILFPSLAPILLLSVAAIPLTLDILKTFVDSLLILTGYNQDKPARCHDPVLTKTERNKELDIYKTQAEASFSYQELNQYYKIKQDLKKPKENRPPPTTNKLFKTTQETKQMIMEKGETGSPYHLERITFFATKAKIIDIQRTLKLVDHPSELKQNHEDYKAAKCA